MLIKDGFTDNQAMIIIDAFQDAISYPSSFDRNLWAEKLTRAGLPSQDAEAIIDVGFEHLKDTIPNALSLHYHPFQNQTCA